MERTVGVISLGCAKNRVDAEIMLGLLTAAGYRAVPPEEGETLLVNTCGFVEEAKREAVNELLRWGLRKASGRPRWLVATGCLAQRYADQLLEEMPELDAAVGIADYLRIVDILQAVQGGQRGPWAGPPPVTFVESGPRLLSTPPGWAYLKIAEGCDNRCTYCAIPSIRGGFRSRPLPAVLEEAGRLVAAGARELVLVAQDTTRYGMDLYGQPVLHRLLEELDGLAGLEWVRVMYAHPGRVSGAVREALRGLPKVVPYLDLPLQHVADRVLARMGRGYTGAQARELIDCLRRDVPGIALRTTLMVGFPGESREEFAQLRRFVEEERLDWLGVFAFAAEEGTAAAAWGDSVSPEEKRERREELLHLQAGITAAANRRRVGLSLPVLVEGRGRRYAAYGRAAFQAPEVDGRVLLRGPAALRPGQMARVRVSAARGYDLVGEVEG